jgi:hypothetical protein
LRGVIDEAFRNGARIVPDGATRAGVEGKGVVGRSDEQDAVDGDGRDLEPGCVAEVKDPLRAEIGDVRGRNLHEIAKAPTGVVTIVRDPVCAGGLGKQIFGPDVDRGGDGGGRLFLSGGEP